MVYRKERSAQERGNLVLDLIAEGTSSELAEVADRTAIKYLKDGEEEWLATRQTGYAGIHTGYAGMDALMGSFLPGELFTIGGDTGHGKSLLAMNIAQNVYQQYLQPVLVVNLELTENQARERFYELSGMEHDYAGIMIQTASSVTYKDIDTLMKRAKEEGACLVIIDHLHFFDDSLGDNQASVLGRIMKNFKECAVQNELPIILLSHVTLMKRTEKGHEVYTPPDLHSFRGSKSIQQTSDMVGFVYRDPEDPSTMEFFMRKNRSRALNKDSIYFEQTDWRLSESWVPSSIPSDT